MQETWVQSLGHGDLLKEGMATHLSGKSHGQRSLAEYIHRVAKSWTELDMIEVIEHTRYQLSRN